MKLKIEENSDMIRFALGDVTTGWMKRDDTFVQRIREDNLNRFYRDKHIAREIEIKNILDDGIKLLNSKRFKKAIDCFDKVLFYDEKHFEALMLKSQALFGQGHFVKSFRFYKRAVRCGADEDVEYRKTLLKKSGEERGDFPKIKRNIYAGDEAVAKGDFKAALDFYDKALVNPSRFKNKILYKLLNKKAFILIRLERFDGALASFDVSIKVHENDMAYYGRGFCEYKLGFDCENSLIMAKNISKKYILQKAQIFNKLKIYEKALESFNLFLDNYFVIDLKFKRAIEGKCEALDNLGLDSSFEKDILLELSSLK